MSLLKGSASDDDAAMLKSTVVVSFLAITAVPAAPQTPATGQRFTLAGNVLRGNAGLQRNLLEAADADARSVVDRFFDAYRTLDVDRLVNVFATDGVFEDPTFRQRHEGHEGIRRAVMEMRATFSNVSIQVHSSVIDGDTVATEETVSGVLTHRDGRPRNIKVRSASFFRIRNGQIQRLTQYSDVQTFQEQTRGGA
jgi:steroid delta-isomerase-like uncharacterized protein